MDITPEDFNHVSTRDAAAADLSKDFYPDRSEDGYTPFNESVDGVTLPEAAISRWDFVAGFGASGFGRNFERTFDWTADVEVEEPGVKTVRKEVKTWTKRVDRETGREWLEETVETKDVEVPDPSVSRTTTLTVQGTSVFFSSGVYGWLQARALAHTPQLVKLNDVQKPRSVDVGAAIKLAAEAEDRWFTEDREQQLYASLTKIGSYRGGQPPTMDQVFDFSPYGRVSVDVDFRKDVFADGDDILRMYGALRKMNTVFIPAGSLDGALPPLRARTTGSYTESGLEFAGRQIVPYEHGPYPVDKVNFVPTSPDLLFYRDGTGSVFWKYLDVQHHAEGTYDQVSGEGTSTIPDSDAGLGIDNTALTEKLAPVLDQIKARDAEIVSVKGIAGYYDCSNVVRRDIDGHVTGEECAVDYYAHAVDLELNTDTISSTLGRAVGRESLEWALFDAGWPFRRIDAARSIELVDPDATVAKEATYCGLKTIQDTLVEDMRSLEVKLPQVDNGEARGYVGFGGWMGVVVEYRFSGPRDVGA